MYEKNNDFRRQYILKCTDPALNIEKMAMQKLIMQITEDGDNKNYKLWMGNNIIAHDLKNIFPNPTDGTINPNLFWPIEIENNSIAWESLIGPMPHVAMEISKAHPMAIFEVTSEDDYLPGITYYKGGYLSDKDGNQVLGITYLSSKLIKNSNADNLVKITIPNLKGNQWGTIEIPNSCIINQTNQRQSRVLFTQKEYDVCFNGKYETISMEHIVDQIAENDKKYQEKQRQEKKSPFMVNKKDVKYKLSDKKELPLLLVRIPCSKKFSETGECYFYLPLQSTKEDNEELLEVVPANNKWKNKNVTIIKNGKKEKVSMQYAEIDKMYRDKNYIPKYNKAWSSDSYKRINTKNKPNQTIIESDIDENLER